MYSEKLHDLSEKMTDLIEQVLSQGFHTEGGNMGPPRIYKKVLEVVLTMPINWLACTCT